MHFTKLSFLGFALLCSLTTAQAARPKTGHPFSKASHLRNSIDDQDKIKTLKNITQILKRLEEGTPIGMRFCADKAASYILGDSDENFYVPIAIQK